MRDLLEEVVADQDEYWGGGLISPSAYETAWVAMVRDPLRPHMLAFPDSLAWLLKHQQRDGSWGPPPPFSVVPTMAAVLALKKAPQQTRAVAHAADRGERYLRQTFVGWSADSIDTPFFEFLVPVLAAELAQLGTSLPVPQLDVMFQRSSDKLQRLPLQLVYAGRSNLVHALEALGKHLDYRRLRAVRAPDGSYGCSPSATAAVLIYGAEWDEAAARWLRALSARAVGGMRGGMPASYPADAFEAAWVAHFVLHGGISLTRSQYPALSRLLFWLQASLSAEGASFARSRGLPCDADDTAVVLAILNAGGMHTPPDPLWAFERDDHFVSYPGERTASTSANAHVLEALLRAESIMGTESELAPRRDRIVRYLLDERGGDAYWTDKWHLGPYYATLSCVLALTQVPDARVHAELTATADWLVAAQRRNGSWGTAASTAEETAYAVLTLCRLQHVVSRARSATHRWALQRGRQYLRRHLRDLRRARPLPALWVDKSVYTPFRVVRAAALAALHAPSV